MYFCVQKWPLFHRYVKNAFIMYNFLLSLSSQFQLLLDQAKMFSHSDICQTMSAFTHM